MQGVEALESKKKNSYALSPPCLIKFETQNNLNEMCSNEVECNEFHADFSIQEYGVESALGLQVKWDLLDYQN